MVIVGLTITLSILALLTLAFTVRARIDLKYSDTLSLTVSFFGIKLFILPKKQKKYKLSNYTLKKIAKRDAKKAKKDAKKAEKKKTKRDEKNKKKAEKKKLTKEEKKALKATKPAFSDTADLFLSLIRLFFGKFFKRFHFHVAKIRIKVGSSDAATTALLYCGICTALENLLVLLSRQSNLHGMKRADVNISTDFLREDMEFDVDLGFSMSIGALLGVLLRVLFSGLIGWEKIQPAKVSKQDEKSKENNKEKQNT